MPHSLPVSLSTSMPVDIKEMSPADLGVFLSGIAVAPYRAGQILRWVYQRQVDCFEDMTDINKPLRSLLAENFRIDRLGLADKRISEDGTTKFLFELRDGELIETVLIPEQKRFTLCISSQAGCAQGCTFCATGNSGFTRNLTQGEILAQVRDVKALLPEPVRLTNIVFMGMGEPLANFNAVTGALAILTSNQNGMGFSTRKVTVSTVGLANRIPDLGKHSLVCLAISLNAVDNETRTRLMPVNRTFPLEALLDACRRYPLQKRRWITFEYILIKGVNDAPADARKLVRLLNGLRYKVNLIAFNPHPGCDFERPDEKTILAFQGILHQKNLTAIIRRSKGRDIAAACGQLRAARQTLS